MKRSLSIVQHVQRLRRPHSAVRASNNYTPSTGSVARRCFSLGPSNVNSYAASHAPDDKQLNEASRFFTKQAPLQIYQSPVFRKLPDSTLPEVTFLGRSNVGKSSIINALFRHIAFAPISSKPGKTRMIQAYGVSPHPLSLGKKDGSKDAEWKRLRGGLLLVDLPGYGFASRTEWGQEISKYLRQRKQLRRAFVLIDSERGLKDTDKAMLEGLVADGVPHSLVLSKVDKVFNAKSKDLGNQAEKIRSAVNALKDQLSSECYRGRSVPGDILCVSTKASVDDKHLLGVAALRFAVLSACNLQRSSRLSKGLNMTDIKILDEPAVPTAA